MCVMAPAAVDTTHCSLLFMRVLTHCCPLLSTTAAATQLLLVAHNKQQDGQVNVYDISRGGRCAKSVHALVKWPELKRLTAIAVTSTAVTATGDTPVSGSASKAARAHDVIAVGGESGLIMLWHQVLPYIA